MTPAPRPTADATLAAMADAGDRELLGAARSVLERAYVAGRHDVAAAVRVESGAIVTGLHLEASQGRASVCAESGALSAAGAAFPGEPVTAIVAVLRRADGTDYLIEPCGVCAELLVDHCPDARVWVGHGDTPEAVTPARLLPFHHPRPGRLAAPSSATPAQENPHD
ncbi:cytidine deaminase [Demequina aestuarii]|uniref:cytidine deaminase n=1 Tax=Demequina aestuarii TaxID=327095 RepID=UPI000AD30618|nr:cytidine deaminase [Demequina aestuarii]